MTKPEVGSVAPNFESPDEQTMSWILSGHLELGPVMLVFYRGDWCAYDNGQLAGLARNFASMERRRVQIAGVSVDPPQNNLDLSNRLALPFPLLSDPTGEICRLYGLWDPESGLANPAIVAIAQDGSVKEMLAGQDVADRPDRQEISRVVKSFGRHSPGVKYRGGAVEVSVSRRDTRASVRPPRRAMSLEEMLFYFDGALLSSGLISSRLRASGRSRKTLREVDRAEDTLKTYRAYIEETARLRGVL